jgi:hypothetical protein
MRLLFALAVLGTVICSVEVKVTNAQSGAVESRSRNDGSALYSALDASTKLLLDRPIEQRIEYLEIAFHLTDAQKSQMRTIHRAYVAGQLDFSIRLGQAASVLDAARTAGKQADFASANDVYNRLVMLRDTATASKDSDLEKVLTPEQRSILKERGSEIQIDNWTNPVRFDKSQMAQMRSSFDRYVKSSGEVVARSKLCDLVKDSLTAQQRDTILRFRAKKAAVDKMVQLNADTKLTESAAFQEAVDHIAKEVDFEREWPSFPTLLSKSMVRHLEPMLTKSQRQAASREHEGSLKMQPEQTIK